MKGAGFIEPKFDLRGDAFAEGWWSGKSLNWRGGVLPPLLFAFPFVLVLFCTFAIVLFTFDESCPSVPAAEVKVAVVGG